MNQRAWLGRYAALGVMTVGGLEWLLGRVVSRFAAVPPLEGIGRTIVEALGRAGLFLVSTSFILGATLYFVTTLTMGEGANRRRDVSGLALALYLTVFGVFLVAHAIFTLFSLFGDEAWLNVTFNILSLVAVWWVSLRFIFSSLDTHAIFPTLWFKVGVLLVVLAYSGWYYSVLYAWLSGPGSVGAGGPADALRLGELAAVLAPVAFFAAIAIPGGEWRSARRWIAPAIVLVLFAAGNIADIIANQGYTGVFAIWSVGFTLWLPWPLYAVSLALYLFSLLTCFAQKQAGASPFAGTNRGMGLLLLLFAGFYLQLTYQHLLALLALLLLTGYARPLPASRIEGSPRWPVVKAPEI
jgi:hypothetical protein